MTSPRKGRASNPPGRPTVAQFVQIAYICNHGHDKLEGLVGVGEDLGYRGYRVSLQLVGDPKKKPL